MPANLKMRIEPEQGRKMSYQMSSGMHGLLMEMIPAEQAAKLHEQGLRPYSQYLSLEGDTVHSGDTVTLSMRRDHLLCGIHRKSRNSSDR